MDGGSGEKSISSLPARRYDTTRARVTSAEDITLPTLKRASDVPTLNFELPKQDLFRGTCVASYVRFFLFRS